MWNGHGKRGQAKCHVARLKANHAEPKKQLQLGLLNAIDTLNLQMVFSTCLHPLSLRHIGQIQEHCFRTMAVSTGSTFPLDISMASPTGAPRSGYFRAGGWNPMESR